MPLFHLPCWGLPVCRPADPAGAVLIHKHHPAPPLAYALGPAHHLAAGPQHRVSTPASPGANADCAEEDHQLLGMIVALHGQLSHVLLQLQPCENQLNKHRVTRPQAHRVAGMSASYEVPAELAAARCWRLGLIGASHCWVSQRDAGVDAHPNLCGWVKNKLMCLN
ncbi:hypothetical protein HaLaN_05901, partial [Haematococcus lacustris]